MNDTPKVFFHLSILRHVHNIKGTLRPQQVAVCERYPILSFYLSVTLYVILGDPGGLAGAQRRLVRLTSDTINYFH